MTPQDPQMKSDPGLNHFLSGEYVTYWWAWSAKCNFLVSLLFGGLLVSAMQVTKMGQEGSTEYNIWVDDDIASIDRKNAGSQGRPKIAFEI